MKTKNNAVEFWRFLMTFGVVAAHVNRYYRETRTVIFAGDGMVMMFFFCFLGYFMFQGYKSKKAKGMYDGKTPSQIAASYLGARAIRLLPVLFFGILLCFVIRNAFINHAPIVDWPAMLLNSTYEFFGLTMTGINWTGDGATWFPAGWFISSAMIAGYFAYYLIAKNEDRFVGFIAPLSIMLVFGWSSLSENGMRWMNPFAGGMNLFSPIYVFAGMCVGVLVWKLVNNLQKIEFSSGWTTFLTIFHACLMVFMLVNILGTKCYFNVYIMYFWSVVECIIVLLLKDPISKALNNKFMGVLGGLAIYMYAGHRAWAFLWPAVFADKDYYFVMALVVVSTIITGIILKFIIEKGIVPFILKTIEHAKASMKEEKQ